MSDPHHPEITVKLTGHDSNAMAIIAAVRIALHQHGINAAEFTNEATSGDYNNVLNTAMKWVTVE